MAKYDVLFSCGHTERIELFGKDSERKRKIEYFQQKGICSACYKKEQKDKETKATGALLIDFSENFDGVKKVRTGYKDGRMTYRDQQPNEDMSVRIIIGEMEGSPKQIAWAHDIKEKFIRTKLSRVMDAPDQLLHAAQGLDPSIQTMQDCVNMLISNNPAWRDFLLETSAKEVIDKEQQGKLFFL